MFKEKAPSLLEQGIEVLYVHPNTKVRCDKESAPRVTLKLMEENPERDNYNIAVRGESIQLFDLDFYSSEAAELATQMIAVEIGLTYETLVTRLGTWPKVGIPFILKEGPVFTKLKSKAYVNDAAPAKGKFHHQLEVIGKGFYWIPHGSVSSENNKGQGDMTYDWYQGDEPIDDFELEIDFIPRITMETVNRVIAIVEKLATGMSWVEVESGRRANGADFDGGDDDDFLDIMVPPLENMPVDKMRYYLSTYPEREWDDYDRWTFFGFAIWYQSKGEDWGLDLWVEFSQNSDKYEDGECEKKWPTFDHTDNERAIKFDSVVKLANSEHAASEVDYFREHLIANNDQSKAWEDTFKQITKSEYMSDMNKKALMKTLNKKIRTDGGDAPGVGTLKEGYAEAKKEAKKQGAADLDVLTRDVLKYAKIPPHYIIFQGKTLWLYNGVAWEMTDPQVLNTEIYLALEAIEINDPPRYYARISELTPNMLRTNITDIVYKDVFKRQNLDSIDRDPMRLIGPMPSTMNC